MKKRLLMALSLAMIAVMAITGTMAYLTSTDSDVNVMTVGNVKIEQIELERVEQTNSGTDELQEFTQDKPLYPAVGERDFIDDVWQEWPTGGSSALYDTKLKNVVDKFVFVKNTGKSDAYVRTIFAFEAGDLTWEKWNELFHLNINDTHWDWEDEPYTEITVEGVRYFMTTATYTGNAGTDGLTHKDGVLGANETTRPSLLQYDLDSSATNEDIASLGETYNILVGSQAVQAAGFADPKTGLDTAIYEVSAINHPWKYGIEKFQVGESQYVTIEEAIEAIAASETKSGIIELKQDISIAETVFIHPGLTVEIDGSGYEVTRQGGLNGWTDPEFNGTMFSVGEGATLQLADIVIDGGAEWTGAVDNTLQRGTVNSGITATGNIVAASNNAKIILNEGAVLQNNAGAHAVTLGTRIGAALTLNGGKIINNQSDSGAIWGGGTITINSGEISGNSSTGSAGVIRMVSECDLTMNGGKISNNKSAGDGGVIWGYGSSTYNFAGGEIANNEAVGTGGVMYTGNYSVVNISGNFEMHDNKAANSGAIRLTDHTSMDITGGKIYGNEQNGTSNAFNTWNNSISITGGTVSDDFSFVGGLGLTIGEAYIDGVIYYDLSTNHNTAYLASTFNSFKFKVNEADEHFANFNFKPADGYTYVEGDEDKLICLNEGYEVYWDTATSTFRLQAK